MGTTPVQSSACIMGLIPNNPRFYAFLISSNSATFSVSGRISTSATESVVQICKIFLLKYKNQQL